jgi:hypothetical protein
MKTKLLITLWLVIFSDLLRAAHPLDLWGQRTAPGSGYTLNAVAFANGVFVAVGGSGTILISSDGANWTNSSPGNYGDLRNVHFLNGQFTVVGYNNQMLRSSNGITWTATALPVVNYWDVAFGNGTYVLAGDTNFVSTDGLNWIPAGPVVSIPPIGNRRLKFDTLTFGNGVFVAMANHTFAAAYGTFSSADGTNWTLTSGLHSEMATRSEMIYENGLYVLAYNPDAFQFLPSGQLYSSTDASVWQQGTGYQSYGGFSTAFKPTSVAYGGGHFVAAGRSSALTTFAFVSSTNSIEWQWRWPSTNFSAPTDFFPGGVAFGNGTFVGVGSDGSGPIIYQSGNFDGSPTILTEPLDRAAVVGNPASFSVVAGGSNPLFYQWQKDSVTISGATNNSFTISNVVATDSGGYRVIVTNSFGSVTSRVAQLSISFLQIHNYAGITILGIPGKTYRIEVSPQAGGSWTVLTNLVLPKTPFIWIDYDSPNVAARIYRAGELP